MISTPLQGLKVVELARVLAGPWAGQILADLGAEVIKVENGATGGDASRQMGPHPLGPDDSQYFQTFNTNKKSVALDIKTEDGRAAFLQLVATADAVVNYLRGDQPEKLGIDYATLAEVITLAEALPVRHSKRLRYPRLDRRAA